MKKITAIVIVLATVTFGCNKNDYIKLSDSDKSVVMFTANDGAPTFPKISYAPNGSLTDEYLSFDDVTVKTKFDGPVTAPSDITVTYSIDAAALTKLNADAAAANPAYKPFDLMPDSTFSLLVTSDVIKKGEVYAPKVFDNVVTHPQKIDPSKNYMIPISVKSSAYPSAVGSKTIFIFIIGNPLAGGYNNVGTRYNYTGVIGYTGGPIPPGGAPSACPAFKVLIPTNDKLCVVDYANLGTGTGRDYLITYDPAISTTNLDVTFTAGFLAGISNVLFVTHAYDPVLKKITLLSTYNNLPGGAGNDRIVTEVMTK